MNVISNQLRSISEKVVWKKAKSVAAAQETRMDGLSAELLELFFVILNENFEQQSEENNDSQISMMNVTHGTFAKVFESAFCVVSLYLELFF